MKYNSRIPDIRGFQVADYIYIYIYIYAYIYILKSYIHIHLRCVHVFDTVSVKIVITLQWQYVFDQRVNQVNRVKLFQKR